MTQDGLINSFPAVVTIGVNDTSLYWQVGYKNPAYGSIANFQTDPQNSFLFVAYDTMQNQIGEHYLLGYGGLGFGAGSIADIWGTWASAAGTSASLGIVDVGAGKHASDNTPMITMLLNGNVGIGLENTTPTATLHILDSTPITGATTVKIDPGASQTNANTLLTVGGVLSTIGLTFNGHACSLVANVINCP